MNVKTIPVRMEVPVKMELQTTSAIVSLIKVASLGVGRTALWSSLDVRPTTAKMRPCVSLPTSLKSMDTCASASLVFMAPHAPHQQLFPSPQAPLSSSTCQHTTEAQLQGVIYLLWPSDSEPPFLMLSLSTEATRQSICCWSSQGALCV